VLAVSLELWLFAVVMELIVIGTFFGGTFLAYRIGHQRSARTAESPESRITPVSRRVGGLGAPTEREDSTAPAA
jgi:hypothetical protein